MKKNFIYGKLCLLAFVIMLIAIQTTISQAQLKTRTQHDSIVAERNHHWYHPEYYQFQSIYPKLLTVPPLSTDMPLDILLSYIYLDSLMRNISLSDLKSRYFNRWNDEKIKNDTIINMIKYAYKIIDYDPIRFYQYSKNTSSGFYKTEADYLNRDASDILNSIVGRTNLAISQLMFADYILRVHVNSVTSLPAYEYPNKGIMATKYTYQVNATVIDTLKGKVFPSCNNNQSLITKSSTNKTLSDNSTICFTYISFPYPNVDNSLLDTTSDSYPYNLVLKPGEDLIIFTSHCDYYFDYNYDYFEVSLNTVLPIINGQVKDIDYEWSNSILLDYSVWKNIFLKKRDILLNGGY